MLTPVNRTLVTTPPKKDNDRKNRGASKKASKAD